VGILMHFYAGDARLIGQVEGEPEGSDIDLRSAPFVRAHVDFSLHLSPEDLDPLVEMACAARGAAPLGLTSSLTEHLAGDADPMVAEFGADVVSPGVVEVIAALTQDQVPVVVEQWCRAVGAETTRDAEAALRGLVALCQVARDEGLPVVFTWSL
jgi:hypothetical protein